VRIVGCGGGREMKEERCGGRGCVRTVGIIIIIMYTCIVFSMMCQ
jgi:hypothetical protein